MKITHFDHACLLVETGDARLLFDPGTESSGFEDLRDLTAILITHEHDDHVDYEKLPALLAANPGPYSSPTSTSTSTCRAAPTPATC
jgi:L-ascorbate metabolism protein UlaG (beta-lactamase superfamily)